MWGHLARLYIAGGIDVGTNNQKLLNDPMYMGIRKPRISADEYNVFVDQFIDALQERWPGVLIQFEDFAQPNAMPLLQRHRERVCCFNDDIQGTAAVTLGTLLAACRKKVKSWEIRCLFFSAQGLLGGIAELVVTAMVGEGMAEADARARVCMVDKYGLVVDDMEGLMDFQQRLAQARTHYAHWSLEAGHGNPRFIDVINNARPTVLVGASGIPGLFSEEVVKAMYSHCPQPIIFPLSNPSRQIEAHPKDVIEWTEGNAIVATGSPFDSVEYRGKTYEISQCNNSYIFPGIGLGVISCYASRISDEMLMVASTTSARTAPASNNPEDGILPPLTSLQEISMEIAFAVAKMAAAQDLCRN